MFTIVAVGMNILVGMTGLVSLGHAGLFAVGAYTSALLGTRLDVSFWLSAGAAIVVTGAVGSVLALAALRARGIYLAMVTIASMVAAGGLGDNVLRAIQKNEVGNGVIAGLAIVFMAIVIDRLTQAVARSRQEALSAGH